MFTRISLTAMTGHVKSPLRHRPSIPGTGTRNEPSSCLSGSKRSHDRVSFGQPEPGCWTSARTRKPSENRTRNKETLKKEPSSELPGQTSRHRTIGPTTGDPHAVPFPQASRRQQGKKKVKLVRIGDPQHFGDTVPVKGGSTRVEIRVHPRPFSRGRSTTKPPIWDPFELCLTYSHPTIARFSSPS